MPTKLNQIIITMLFLVSTVGCQVDTMENSTLYGHTCLEGDAQQCRRGSDDPNCYCNHSSSTCEKYCYDNRIAKVYFSTVRGGRICGTIYGCIPPIDINELRIIQFTLNPAESSSVIRSFETISSEQGMDIFAKGELEKYDEKLKEATFKYTVINPDLAQKELVVEITTFVKDMQGNLEVFKMESDPFPKGHFLLK